MSVRVCTPRLVFEAFLLLLFIAQRFVRDALKFHALNKFSEEQGWIWAGCAGIRPPLMDLSTPVADISNHHAPMEVGVYDAPPNPLVGRLVPAALHVSAPAAPHARPPLLKIDKSIPGQEGSERSAANEDQAIYDRYDFSTS